MTVSLDPKSARKIVTGLLTQEDKKLRDKKAEIEAYNKELAKANVASHLVCGKIKATRKDAEDKMEDTFGDTILFGSWSGRNFSVVVLDPVPPNNEDSRPIYGILIQYNLNIRSGNFTRQTMAEITTHFMERLLARKADTKLLELIKEELTSEVLASYCDEVRSWHNKGSLEYSYKLKTANGIGCVAFQKGSSAPVFTTWYP